MGRQRAGGTTQGTLTSASGHFYLSSDHTVLKFVKRNPGASHLSFISKEHLDVFDEENNKLTSIDLRNVFTANFIYEGICYEISRIKTGLFTGKWVITANGQPFGELQFPGWAWKKPKLLLHNDAEPWTFTLKRQGWRRHQGELVRHDGQVLYHTSGNKIPAINLHGYDVSSGKIESYGATPLVQIIGLYMNNRVIFQKETA